MSAKHLMLVAGFSILLLFAAILPEPRLTAPLSAAGSTYSLFFPLVARPAAPRAVGYQFRWDGSGYVRGSDYYDIGVHQTMDLNGMTDTDTIRAHGLLWYSPNPLSFSSETWDSYYSVSTGYWKSSSYTGDPGVKWGYDWIIPFDRQFQNGQPVQVSGQTFNVMGPLSGYTAFGQAYQYWKLVNRDKFLYWDGGDYKQYVHPGEAILLYDAGSSRLNTENNLLRRDYYRGNPNGDTVQYIEKLISASSFSAADRVVLNEPDAKEANPMIDSRVRGSPATWGAPRGLK